jgi:hypothetical protein
MKTFELNKSDILFYVKKENETSWEKDPVGIIYDNVKLEDLKIPNKTNFASYEKLGPKVETLSPIATKDFQKLLSKITLSLENLLNQKETASTETSNNSKIYPNQEDGFSLTEIEINLSVGAKSYFYLTSKEYACIKLVFKRKE